MDCVDTINRARDLLGTERSEAEFVGLVLGGLIRNMRRGRGEMYYIWVLLLHALPGGDCLERVDVLLLRKYQGAGWDDIFDIPHSYEQTVRVG
jgi:hypothetical protein